MENLTTLSIALERPREAGRRIPAVSFPESIRLYYQVRVKETQWRPWVPRPAGSGAPAAANGWSVGGPNEEDLH
jgi:hypothetical protein